MLNPASARRRKKSSERLNLVPILDAVFIFIFFLLASSSFVQMYEVSSDIPAVSEAPPPPPKKTDKLPLNLTLKVRSSKTDVFVGSPLKRIKTFQGRPNTKLFNRLHDYLVALKKDNVKEETVVFEPDSKLDYQIIIELMDAVRQLRYNDPKFTRMNDRGEEEEIKTLFSDIIFGNLES